MTELQVNSGDLQAFNQILDGIEAPASAKNLMSAIATSINDLIAGQEGDVTVTIESEAPITEQFEESFALDAPAGHALQVRVKIGK
jgi:hypothetical protein